MDFRVIHRRSNTSYLRLSCDDYGSPYANTVCDLESSEYLMKIQIGTPPVEIEAMIDRKPPHMDTMLALSKLLQPSKSYTNGTYVSETLTIQSTSGQPFLMPEILIGCGHNNSGLVSTTSGIVGLNWAATSLTSQMGERFLGLLSYCFSGTETSKINFGANSIVAGDGTVAADMFRKADKPDYYYLNLDAISVGDIRVETLGTPFYATNGIHGHRLEPLTRSCPGPTWNK
ncbi:unnamed protein product [Microthlaspi erraticum]|uniref:Xylanase inhibitor N-terminal domain-containing protein n=1 Tax=Microthlaspi erraticum TaxID=1685480 RepID=A0A6D2JZD6_9BRAS|nr:unnamed protein product [Microthlaspi erraticum]